MDHYPQPRPVLYGTSADDGPPQTQTKPVRTGPPRWPPAPPSAGDWGDEPSEPRRSHGGVPLARPLGITVIAIWNLFIGGLFLSIPFAASFIGSMLVSSPMTSLLPFFGVTLSLLRADGIVVGIVVLLDLLAAVAFLADGVQLWRLGEQANDLAVVLQGIFGVFALLSAVVSVSVLGVVLAVIPPTLIISYLLRPRNRYRYDTVSNMTPGERLYLKWRQNYRL